MVKASGRGRAWLLVGALLTLTSAVAVAQQGPVASMFADDQKRGQAISLSFTTAEVPPTAGAPFPAQIYLSGGDLERAFDRTQFRPDGAIVPTNTELMITAASPATQAVLIERVRKQSAVMRDLQEQVETRKKSTAGAQDGVLNIGVDTFVAELPRGVTKQGSGAFPRIVCMIATDFPKGGAIDRRELFAQDRVRKGIASCLTALDAAGVQSLVMPLMGAASAGTLSKDSAFEGQRVLKECRFMNAVAGIALGIHDFAPNRRRLREIGIVQWDAELEEMFSPPRGSRLAQTFQNAYRAYTEQINAALRRGLAGEKTAASDVDGACNAIFTP